MNPILTAGLLIGALCSLWIFVMGLSGWYKDPGWANVFFLVVVIEIGGLFWGLRRTAAEGRAYRQQIVAGTFMAIIAGVLIIVSSLVFTMAAFPDYFDQLEAVQRQRLSAEGRSAEEIERATVDFRTTATPMSYAMNGFIGTLVTGIIASAVIAIAVRARPAGGRT